MITTTSGQTDPVRKQRKARLLKASKTAQNETDVIVVTIQHAFQKTDTVQTSKKINLANVIGKDFSIPVSGMSNTTIYYDVEINNGRGEIWKLEKCYDDFYQLHERIKSRFPAVSQIISTFPKRKIFAPTIASPQVKYRQNFFQAYLQALLQLKPRLSDINDFLEISKHVKPEKKKELNIEDFEILKLLGKGSFGKVFLARVIGSEKLFAMKVLKKSEVKKRNQIEHTKTELRVMGGSDHPFICSLRYAFTTDTRLFMVSEFCQGGELFFHLKQMRKFSREMVTFYSGEIALGLDYLHSKNIIYRDIKPENVLLDEGGHIKITDFGLSKDGVDDPQGATTFCGTPEYVSPEMLLGMQKGYGYGKAVDWWGLGILMYEMYFGWPPFYDENKKIMCRKIVRSPLVFSNGVNKIDKDSKDIITQFLVKNPENRLGICGNGFLDIKSHPFFKDIDWEKLLMKQIEPPFKPKIDGAITNFDAEFTDQSAKISDHEQRDTVSEIEDEEEEEGEQDVFEDFAFSRDATNPDAFWDAHVNVAENVGKLSF